MTKQTQRKSPRDLSASGQTHAATADPAGLIACEGGFVHVYEAALRGLKLRPDQMEVIRAKVFAGELSAARLLYTGTELKRDAKAGPVVDGLGSNLQLVGESALKPVASEEQNPPIAFSFIWRLSCYFSRNGNGAVKRHSSEPLTPGNDNSKPPEALQHLPLAIGIVEDRKVRGINNVEPHRPDGVGVLLDALDGVVRNTGLQAAIGDGADVEERHLGALSDGKSQNSGLALGLGHEGATCEPLKLELPLVRRVLTPLVDGGFGDGKSRCQRPNP